MSRACRILAARPPLESCRATSSRPSMPKSTWSPHAPLHVVILAAGEGKRMKSALPKVLQKIAGRPMLAHVIDAARALRPAGIHVVYGHRRRAGARRVRRPARTCTGPSRRSSSAPAMRCSRRCRTCRDGRARAGAVRRRAADHAGDAAAPAGRAGPPRGAGGRPGRSHRLRPHRCAMPKAASPRSSSTRMPTTSSARIRLVNTGIIAADGDRAAALARARCATTTRRASTT